MRTVGWKDDSKQKSKLLAMLGTDKGCEYPVNMREQDTVEGYSRVAGSKNCTAQQ